MREFFRKIKLPLFIILIIIAVLFILTCVVYSNKKTISYVIEGKKYHLLVAKTPAEWEKGLMDIYQKENYDGMMFVFPEKSKQNFWNKNTYLDLDIYWIDDDSIVGKSFLPSIDKTKEIAQVTSPQEVNKVVEIIR